MDIVFVLDDYIIDPLGVAYLISYLKNGGYSVDIVKITDKDWLSQIEKINPWMVCYSVSTATFRKYLEVCSHVKKITDAFSLFGGPHCTFFPEIQEDKNVDAICRGEGFEAIVDVADCVSKGQYPEKVLNINNNPLRPLLDKTKMLHPDRDVIYKFEKNLNNPIKNVMCTFGCMQNCTYCYAAQYREMYGLKGVEVRPPENVISEIKELLAYPMDLLFFQDDIFPIYNRNWIDRFCDGYKDIRKPFHIQVRIDMVKKDVIGQLVDVGLHGVTFAIESSDENFRRNVLNRRITNETIINNNKILKDYGLNTRTENMLGAPGDTYEQAMETLKFNASLKPSIGWASVFQPYPGTILGDRYFNSMDIMPESFFDRQLNGNIRISNLQKLFSLGVYCPKLIPVINCMTRLPGFCSTGLSYVYNKVKKLLYSKVLYKVDKDRQNVKS